MRGVYENERRRFIVKIIDVSKHNGTIDWKKVRAAGIDGVIIRAGYGRVISQKDHTFEGNYAGAKAAGLNVGAYWYSYADTARDAATEASVFINAIKGKTFELPVYYDIEELKHSKMSKSLCTSMTNTFCLALESAGYFAGVYSYDSFFATNLDAAIQGRYTVWVARVEHVRPTYCGIFDVHQYSWKGRVNGITGDVDMNDCTRDFPAVIKGAGLNGFGKAGASAAEYRVCAEISGCSQGEAEAVKAACVKLGMNVSVVRK